MRRLRKFLALPAGRRWLVVQSLLVLFCFRAGLRFLPLRTLASYAERFRRPSTEREPDFGIVEQVRWTVDAVGDRLRASCLERALAVQFLMARRGFWSSLRIGVKPPAAGVLHAHAWIEYQGKVIVGGGSAGLADYATLPDLDTHL